MTRKVGTKKVGTDLKVCPYSSLHSHTNGEREKAEIAKPFNRRTRDDRQLRFFAALRMTIKVAAFRL